MQSTLDDVLRTHNRVFQIVTFMDKKEKRTKVIGQLNWVIKTIVGMLVFHFASPEGALFLVCLYTEQLLWWCLKILSPLGGF